MGSAGVVGMDLAQPRLGEARLRRPDEATLLLVAPVEEAVHRRRVQGKAGELADGAPRDLRVAREQEPLGLGLLPGKVQREVLGPQ